MAIAEDIAVICRELCRGVPWDLSFITVGLAVACRESCRGAIGLAAATVPRYAQGNCRGLPRYDMTRDMP